MEDQVIFSIASTTQTVKIHWSTLRHAFRTLLIIHSFRCDSYGLLYKIAFRVHNINIRVLPDPPFLPRGAGLPDYVPTWLSQVEKYYILLNLFYV